MEFFGKIVKWNDEKGFGFIEYNKEDKELFFHVSSFQGGSIRPCVDLQVAFTKGKDKYGRDCAAKVYVVAEKQSLFNETAALTISLSSLAGVICLSLFDYISVWISCIYIAVSGLTFIVYNLDKNRAKENKTRIPEMVLHQLSVFGGWPGALYAQYSLNHKTRKTRFFMWFLVTVLLNLVFLLLLIPQEKIPDFHFGSIFNLEKYLETQKTHIADVLSDPGRFDNSSVTLSGRIYNYDTRISKMGNSYTVLTLRDYSGSIVCHSYGHLSINPEREVTVTGVFRRIKEVRGERFYNQIDISQTHQPE